MPDGFWLALTVAGALGMAGCLYGMYGDRKRGFPALTALDKGFQSLDMRRGYTPEAVYGCFDGVGPEGQRLLNRLWTVDYCFILAFGMVMTAVTHNVAPTEWLAAGMYGAAGGRAIADGVENGLLMAVNRGYPEHRRDGAARAANVATRIKWGFMALWVIGMFVSLLMKAAGASR